MTWFLYAMYITELMSIWQVFAIGSFGLPPAEFVMILFLLLYVPYRYVWLGKPLRVPNNAQLGMMVALLASMLFVGIGPLIDGYQTMSLQSIKTLAHFGFIWAFAAIVLCSDVSVEQWRSVLRLHLSIGMAVCLYGLYQIPARTMDLPLAWLEITNAGFKAHVENEPELGQLALRFAEFYRATSIFPEPSALGSYAANLVFLNVIPWARSGTGFLKTSWARVTSVVLALLALFAAFSMTGILLLCVGSAFVLLRYRKKLFGTLGVIVLVFAVGLPIIDSYINWHFNVSVLELFAVRIESIFSGEAFENVGGGVDGESANMRADDFTIAYKMWLENPLFGVGPGNTEHSFFARNHNTITMSNVYAGTLAEYGPITLFVLLCMYGINMATAYWYERRWTVLGGRERNPQLDDLIACLPVAAALVIFVGLTGNQLISASYWLRYLPVLAGIELVRRALGTSTIVEIYLVRRPWRAILNASQPETPLHGSNH
jgi:hypothetical protein